MEITKKPKIKSIPYDEFIDNESLEKLVKELNAGGANVALGVLDDFINWANPILYEKGFGYVLFIGSLRLRQQQTPQWDV